MERIISGELNATRVDLNFIKHELREMQLMQTLEYEEAHHAVLKEQGIGGSKVDEYEKLLYTPEAIEASFSQWSKR